MSIQWWNGVLNVITNIDYLAIPIAFIVLRNLREPDVPPRVLASRVLFVLACGAHHGIMAVVLFTGQPFWVIRTIINATMAGVSCWSLVEHLQWARTKAPPVSVRAHQELEQIVAERTHDLNETLRELEQAQDDAVRNERLAVLGQLSSGLGHELRNPLGIISNAVYFLDALSPDQDPRVARYHHIIREQIDLSRNIVENLLDFARVKEPTSTAVDLAKVAREQIARLDPGAVDIKFEEAGPSVAWADTFQVGQAMYNILVNAHQAMENQPDRQLYIRTGTENGLATVGIRDNGPGMDAEHLSRIFEPLFTTKARGIGLGLAITRAYLEVNEGTVEAHSRPGEGTEFILRFPSAEAAALAGTAGAVTPGEGRPSDPTGRPATPE